MKKRKIYRGPTVKGRKLGLKSRVWSRRNFCSKHSTRQSEETRIQKNEERLRNLQDNFKSSSILIIGVPEGEGQQQEIENLFGQIMKENYPNMVKEIEFQKVLEAQRVPKKLNPRRNTPRHIIMKSAKIKDKERILKASRGKERVI